MGVSSKINLANCMAEHSEQIFEHPFGAETFNQLQKIPNWEHREFSDFSEPELYVVTVFWWTASLAGCFTRLKHIRAYLSHFRILKQYRESGIDRAGYIKYHYSNHAVTLLGVFDIALILTNNVFRLGHSEKQCRPELIMQNSWIRMMRFDKILRQLDSAVEPSRKPRHLFIHRGYLRGSECLWYLTGVEKFLSTAGSSSRIPFPLVASMYKAEVSRILDELRQQEEDAFKASMELLTGLYPVYESWKKFFAAQEK